MALYYNHLLKIVSLFQEGIGLLTIILLITFIFLRKVNQMKQLLQSYLAGTLNEHELESFLEWARNEENRMLIQEEIENALKTGELSGLADQDRADTIFSNIMKSAARPEPAGGKVRKLYFLKIAIAAVVIFAVAGAAFFWWNDKEQASTVVKGKIPPVSERFRNDILPARDHVVLEMADGKKLVLDSSQGTISTVGGVTVINLSGELSYKAGEIDPAKVEYHTIHTGKGNQYSLKLPDGSQVWMNAMSSLRFPTFFVGNERMVSVMGEAYFEVAHDAGKPFRVSILSGNSSTGIKGYIEVLGTSFNVKAYDSELQVKATLLEGSVKVSKGSNSMIITPGQQVKISDNKGLELVTDVDLEETMAWKNGKFYFYGASLKDIMKDVGRWYDVEFVFEEEIPYSFVARISRDVPISKLLMLLELTDLVHFSIDGKKVFVSKN